MQKFSKNTNGITLIALIVTIIVLLILAAVSLNLVAGESGILGRAETAAIETEKAIEIEKIKLAVTSAYMEDTNYITGIPYKSFKHDFYKEYGKDLANIIGTNEKPETGSLVSKLDSLLIPTSYAAAESPLSTCEEFGCDDCDTNYNYAIVTYKQSNRTYYVCIGKETGHIGGIIDPEKPDEIIKDSDNSIEESAEDTIFTYYDASEIVAKVSRESEPDGTSWDDRCAVYKYMASKNYTTGIVIDGFNEKGTEKIKNGEITTINFPNKIDGKTVIMIDLIQVKSDQYPLLGGITKVIIPSSVKAIADNCFYDKIKNDDLEYEIEEGLECVGYKAFDIKNHYIKLPDTVKKTGYLDDFQYGSNIYCYGKNVEQISNTDNDSNVTGHEIVFFNGTIDELNNTIGFTKEKIKPTKYVYCLGDNKRCLQNSDTLKWSEATLEEIISSPFDNESIKNELTLIENTAISKFKN